MSGKGDSGDREDDWASVPDAQEKRRIQLRNAQRRFRARAKEKEEEDRRAEANQRYAASSYQPPFGSEEVDQTELTGPPWGHLPLGHGIRINRSNRNKSEHSSTQGEDPKQASSQGVGEQGESAEEAAAREAQEQLDAASQADRNDQQ